MQDTPTVLRPLNLARHALLAEFMILTFEGFMIMHYTLALFPSFDAGTSLPVIHLNANSCIKYLSIVH